MRLNGVLFSALAWHWYVKKPKVALSLRRCDVALLLLAQSHAIPFVRCPPDSN